MRISLGIPGRLYKRSILGVKVIAKDGTIVLFYEDYEQVTHLDIMINLLCSHGYNCHCVQAKMRTQEVFSRHSGGVFPPCRDITLFKPPGTAPF